MMRYACGMVVAVVLLVAPSSGRSQQYYLYTPTAVGEAGQVQGKEGVLVREVSVKKGDTLSGISRKFSGHGSYYSQILLFNAIKDPDKIYPGNVFKIPVPRNTRLKQVDKAPVKNEKSPVSAGEAAVPGSVDSSVVQKQISGAPSPAAVTDISAQDLKKNDVKTKRVVREKTAESAKKHVKIDKQHTAAAVNSAKLFERAVKAYRQEDCRSALELFDEYLIENRSSPLAADASLYKADCYLKLSTQK